MATHFDSGERRVRQKKVMHTDGTVRTFEAGWGWPALARKAHWFPENSLTSLCGRWLYSGPREDSDKPSKDDCTMCRHKREKET